MLAADRKALLSRNMVIAANLAADHHLLVQALTNMKAGLRSGSGGPSGKGGHSDPTFAAALADGVDPAQSTLDRLDVLFRDASRVLEEANSIRLRWLHPATFTAAQRDEGCANCARYDCHEEALAYGDVGGRLAEPMNLGRWCIDFVTSTAVIEVRDGETRIIKPGALPVDWQVTDHHAGKRVKHQPAEPLSKLDEDHRLTVVLTTRYPRTRPAEAIADVTAALDRAELAATVTIPKAKAKKTKGKPT